MRIAKESVDIKMEIPGAVIFVSELILETLLD
jgi:hypothetical protein